MTEIDYKNTLNLPNTAFPMKANLATREPEQLERWKTLHLYQVLQDLAVKEQRPQFLLHDGPPYANGNIHLGHAVNKILKDIVTKSRLMAGYAAPYIPGWDCHGLPIEHKIEKQLGKAGHKVSHREFRDACRRYAAEYVALQTQEFQRLGVLGDWEHPYLTMAPHYEANIIRALAAIMAAGYIKQGFKPVYWCLDCASALAQAEVEYEDKTSAAIDVKFVLQDLAQLTTRLNQTLPAKPVIIPIWTTTPWTLPANEGVALNPNMDYGLYLTEDAIFVLGESLATTTLARYGINSSQNIMTIKGQLLEGLSLKHPLFNDKTVSVLLGDHVTTEEGTGAVHTAPAHGPDDFTLGKKYQLPCHNPVGDDGCYIANTPHFAGLHINKANASVLQVLTENNTLLHQAMIKHSYPHCWRHKTPLIFRTTPQWFVDMDQSGLRAMAQEAIPNVEWHPPRSAARMTAMVENNPDWCISRQRTWGVPIPLFLHKETNLPHPNTIALMEEVAKLVEKQGIEAWHELTTESLLGSDAAQYRKGADVLDVWFDSGVTLECLLRDYPHFSFPADLYLEGSDQHRGWFQSSLLASLALRGSPPYKAVITHGFTVDASGKKMSKSLGNTLAPETLTQKYGADILRLWIAASDYRQEITVSHDIFDRTADGYRRLRNTARFLLANLHDFQPEHDSLAVDQLLIFDRYILAKAHQLQEEIKTAYLNYQFHIVYQKVLHFCTLDLGGLYLDIIKDRQYTLPAKHPARRSAQTTMYHLLLALVRWIAPILSFTAEEIWSYIPGHKTESVFLTTWYQELSDLPVATKFTQDVFTTCLTVREEVNKALENARNQNQIGSGLEAEVILFVDATLAKTLALFEDELRFFFITSKVTVTDLATAPSEILASSLLANLKISVERSAQQKCGRCWHRSATVGSTAEHPSLCQRCVTNVTSPGESRKYA